MNLSGSVAATPATADVRCRLRRRSLAVLLGVAALAAATLPTAARAAAPGAVASYAFEEGTGNASADTTGNGRTAALRDTTWTSSGRFGNALRFNGTTSLAQVADSDALDLSGAMTLEAWVRPDTTAGTATVLAKPRNRGGFAYGLELDAGKPAGLAYVGSSTRRAVAGDAVQPGAWRFLAVTYDGSSLRTYLDGEQVAELQASGTMRRSSNPLEIGGNSVWDEGFRGVIDNVRVYPRALSGAELAADRQADAADDDAATTPTPTPTPSPSPTPTPTPSPSPTPTPPTTGANCMPDPSSCGFPDVESVGVKSGAALTPVSGNVTLSTPGQVYENKLVTGSITVTAPNVTIRNVKLVTTDTSYGIRAFGWQNDTDGLLVEDVEIDMNGRLATKGIAFDGYTARRVFFHNGSDCAHFGSGVAIEDSLCVSGPDADDDGWPDTTAFCGGTEHFDGFQSDGGNDIRIRHNTIRVPCSQTSGILMSTNTSGIRNVTVSDNLLAGGGYALYCNAGPDVPNETVSGNRFARTWFPRSGYWGPTTGCEDADVFSGNVWDDTGAAL